ncbi:hypothetical protein [Plebeiibacterium sediminum]|uniref:Uncharacterized protein n=1 Tax=Plebeiibacterium sediminum TaxID=2992112 RepID=A0AAE3M9Z9_9BACT|nr:hypothetical protein [Plebeiobacterium sediminum]MCW3789803.1 hypothetical protein [Plebeiobacterium sediminum]
MDDLVKKIPIELTQLLNSFNTELSEYRKNIEMNSHNIRVRYSNSDFDGVKIIYKQKNSSFYFELEYLLKGDYITWKYYPHAQHSTQEKNRARAKIDPAKTFKELLSSLRLWKNNCC